MRKQRNSIKTIFNIITWIILIVCLYFAYKFYEKNNFNDFLRSQEILYKSNFVRDDRIKYSKKMSYKIESEDFNDAMFYKQVKVEKNKSYKVTCMVKTNDVEAKEEKSGVGAQISIEGTTERSMAISGTTDWQKIELIFNSKNREYINIGFRLGGYLGQAKGQAWFSDFTIEEGTQEKDNEWRFANFIFDKTEVNINGNQVNLKVTSGDVSDITKTISRFESACQILSNGKMKAKCDTYKIDMPLNRLSYDEQFGYYVAPEDVEEQIKDIISSNNYDHIFVIIRLRK